MSGWLGEDFESGGKQWLKTDAKISHGNSGGAAFNAQGQLIGVPTAGITVQYEELDVEEQAFVRPISLAWAVIGPDVANVTRASGVSATTPPPAANNNVVASRVGDPSGECDSIVIGQAVSGTIAGIQGEETVVFHTYVVPVPAGTPAVTISVTGNGADLDLAVKSGGPILDYDDVDHLDVSEDPNPVYVIQNPSAGPVYFDVLNLLTSAANYTAQVTIDGAAGANPLGAGAAGNPLGGQPAPIDVPSIESGIVSDIAFGQQANGELAGVADANSYHTFIVTVPQGGVARLVVRMVANEDLNLAMKFGTEIQTYADDGDWTYRDNSLEPTAEFVIQNPQPGTWYIDVFNGYGPTVTRGYTLIVTAE